MSRAAIKKFLIEVIGLQTSRGRLFALAAASFAIYFLPYRIVGQFSLWQRLGWDWAPSIGLTRAYWLLMHGHPFAAWHRNWLIFPILIVVAVIVGRDIYKLTKGSSARSGQTEK